MAGDGRVSTMCRLFALTAGRVRVHATFWLLDAPDSLEAQSHRNPDGTGLGYFDERGEPVVRKQPIAAWRDAAFATQAHDCLSCTFVAHVRHASTGADAEANTHPFVLDGRIFAHNGVVEGLPDLEAHLGEDLALVRGDTDSERVFALITREIRRAGGDVAAGVTTALRWLAEHVPVYALNVVLATEHELWALRYPATNDLLVLDRADGDGVRYTGSDGRIRMESDHLGEHPSVVFASEPMDDDPRWHHLEPGVLVHVDPDLAVHETPILPDPPRLPLTLADLRPRAAASQETRR